MTVAALCLAAMSCADSDNYAPAVDVSGYEAVPVSGTYRVAPGDTLYSIAWRYGADYSALAKINGITAPYAIHTGQIIYLHQKPARTVMRTPVSVPVATKSAVWRQVETKESLPHPVPETRFQPVSETVMQPVFEAVQQPATKEVKQPVAEIRKQPVAEKVKQPVAEVQKQPAAEEVKQLVTHSQLRAENKEPKFHVTTWQWPSHGKILSVYSRRNKGIDIADRAGTPIYASAPGKVVYAGNGLRGYGNLIIIKHNKQYLSAYAYNRRLLVRAGDWVKKGQVIAEMGKGASGQAMLHFEIRRAGMPVNPLNLLSS